MKTHELKTLQPYFNAVGRDEKTFEIRKDDRGFEVGDYLVLQELLNNKLTGIWLTRKITYILRDAEQFGLMKGFCILGFNKS